MLVRDAQRELRDIYDGGFVGQLVAGAVWLVSVALATWSTHRAAIVVLVVGGALIYPVTSLVLRMRGRRASVDPGNPFRALAIQTAFVLPVSMPLVAPVSAFRIAWFYPAMMVLVGAHYLPFATLYGMRTFLALAAALLCAGIVVALFAAQSFALGGWIACGLLIGFAFVARAEARRIG